MPMALYRGRAWWVCGGYWMHTRLVSLNGAEVAWVDDDEDVEFL